MNSDLKPARWPAWCGGVARDWIRSCLDRKQAALERALSGCSEARRVTLEGGGLQSARRACEVLVEADRDLAVAIIGGAIGSEPISHDLQQLESSLLTVGGSGFSRARDNSSGYETRAAWIVAARQAEQIAAGLEVRHLIEIAVKDHQQGRLSPLSFALNRSLKLGSVSVSTLLFLRRTMGRASG